MKYFIVLLIVLGVALFLYSDEGQSSNDDNGDQWRLFHFLGIGELLVVSLSYSHTTYSHTSISHTPYFHIPSPILQYSHVSTLPSPILCTPNESWTHPFSILPYFQASCCSFCQLQLALSPALSELSPAFIAFSIFFMKSKKAGGGLGMRLTYSI